MHLFIPAIHCFIFAQLTTMTELFIIKMLVYLFVKVILVIFDVFQSVFISKIKFIRIMLQ